MFTTTKRKILYSIIGVIVAVGIFAGGVWSGIYLQKQQTPISTPTPASSLTLQSNTTSASELNTLFTPFLQAWDIVHQDFYTQPVDNTKLMQGAIRGMMDSLGDPHTAYMDPIQLQQAQSQLQGEYEGIGAWVDATGEFLTIISAMPGYPAEKAGLKSGDQVIAVGGKSVTGNDPNVVLTQVLGPAGTSVTLTIQRKDVAPFDVTIIRQKIVLKSVEGKMLANNVAYISLIIFGNTTTQELKDTLITLLAQKPVGLILDLRNNSGGYLETAIEVVSQFISDGNVLIEEQANGARTNRPVLPGGLALQIPMVVLVNEGTASAAEITAGAIQDHHRGLIIGVQTYKKGSVQTWIDLVDSQGAIRVTTEHWLTPDAHEVNGIGITPDIVVSITKEDIAANKDSQLDRAIQAILTGK